MAYPIYTTYLLTNANRSVLYTGMTNNLRRRLVEHWIGRAGAFTTHYQAHFLVWLEDTQYVLNAIALEKRIKNRERAWKNALIEKGNKEWRFLNGDILGYWPLTEEDIADIKALWNQYPNTREAW